MKQNIGKILAIVLVVALCTVFFAACVPSDPAKAEANLKDAGYNVTKADDTTSMAAAAVALTFMGFDVDTNDLNAIVGGSLKSDSVYILYFKDAADAKAFKDECKKVLDEAKAELEKNKDDKTESDYKEAQEDLKNSKYGASGKTAWFGTKAGVKAAG